MADGELRSSWSTADCAAADRLDYQLTVDLVKVLTDIRFRCLAFVTAVTALGGAAVTLSNDPAGRTGLACVGLVATLGIAVYELRNSQLYEAAVHRAGSLERAFGCRPSADHLPPGKSGGVFAERLPYLRVKHWGLLTAAERQAGVRDFKDERKRKAEENESKSRTTRPASAPSLMRFWFVPVKHDWGLGLIYSAALGGWVYLALAALFSIPTAVEHLCLPWVGPTVAGVAAALVAGLTLYWFIRHDEERIHPVASGEGASQSGGGGGTTTTPPANPPPVPPPSPGCG